MKNKTSIFLLTTVILTAIAPLLLTGCDQDAPEVLHYNSVFLVPEDEKLLGCTNNVTVVLGEPISNESSETPWGGVLNKPDFMFLGLDDIIYIADTGNNIIRKLTPGLGVEDFPLEDLTAPIGLAMDSSYNIYVSEETGEIKQFTYAGLPGSLTITDTPGIHGMAVDIATDQVYFSNESSHRIEQVLSFGTTATFAGSSEAISGYADAYKTLALFNEPKGIIIDSDRRIFVADFKNDAIRLITSGDVTTFVKSSGEGAEPGNEVYAPYGLAQDSNGNVFATEYNTGKIKKITPEGKVRSVKVCSGEFFYRIAEPKGILVDNENELLVVESGKNRILRIVPD